MSTPQAAPLQADLLNEREAAAYLRSQPRTLERWRMLGRGPRFVKVGRHVRYRISALEAWLAAQTRERTGVEQSSAA